MIGTYLNTLAILVGTGIGCLLHGGIKPRYQEALYLAIGAVLGTWGNLDERFNRLVDRHSQNQLGRGLSTGISCFIASAPCRSSAR